MTRSFNQSIRIGTRGSPLALAQARETRMRLGRVLDLPHAAFEIFVIKTTGDSVQDRPLGDIGGKGLFTKEIEDALLAREIDIAVHSMKDVPVEQPDGLTFTCFLPREDPRDAFLSRTVTRMEDLPQGAVVGTSSLRRRAQVILSRPDLKIIEFRGNVQTRLRKLDDGLADATFLAKAGLNRLGRSDAAVSVVDTDTMLPAVAQGAIGIEHRVEDTWIAEKLALINDADTTTQLTAERRMLADLDGSCQTPIAGLAKLDHAAGTLTLHGQVLRPDGSEQVSDVITGNIDDALSIGAELAERLLSRMPPGFLDL